MQQKRYLTSLCICINNKWLQYLKIWEHFFSKHKNNIIEFWNCPNNKWYLHTAVDNKTRKFSLVLLYPSKESWDYSKKEECNNIIREWCSIFKSPNLKGRNFLLLLNNNLSACLYKRRPMATILQLLKLAIYLST